MPAAAAVLGVTAVSFVIAPFADSVAVPASSCDSWQQHLGRLLHSLPNEFAAAAVAVASDSFAPTANAAVAAANLQRQSLRACRQTAPDFATVAAAESIAKDSFAAARLLDLTTAWLALTGTLVPSWERPTRYGVHVAVP